MVTESLYENFAKILQRIVSYLYHVKDHVFLKIYLNLAHFEFLEPAHLVVYKFNS